MSLPPRFILPAFFLTLFLGAMILGPILFYTLGWIAPHAVPFHRAMDRALLVSAVAALGLAWTRLPLKKLWPWDRSTWKHLLLGYVMAAVTAQATIGFDLAFSGFTRTLLSFGEMETRILLALTAAILVPLLEETVFRGFLQGEFTDRFGWRLGWIGTAVIFALSHFLKISPDLDREPVYPWSGITALGNAFLPIIHGEFFSGRGLNLFLLGLILGGIVLRSGILWVNAGLHSGLILGVFLFNGFTRPVEPPRVSWLSGDILSNPITSVVFVLLGLWLWRFYRHPSILPETGETAP